MDILSACKVIYEAREDAVLIATMGAMNALDCLGAGQPRLSSVPLMGGAPSLGLGIALARPAQKVIVIDGDASLLMQLGALVAVAGHQPRNFYHFVIHNGTQFTGLSNLSLPGAPSIDFAVLAEAAGYQRIHRFADARTLQGGLPDILVEAGPVFVELEVEPSPPTFGPSNPQQDWSDRQFTRMGEEADKLADWLRTR